MVLIKSPEMFLEEDHMDSNSLLNKLFFNLN